MNWLVAVIIGLLIILLIIFGLVFLIPQLFPSRPAVVTLPTPTPQTIVITPTPTPQYVVPITPGITPTVPRAQTFSGAGFTFEYPESWGLLTCANSLNFELDPNSNVDQIDIPCDVALKSITVIVNQDLLDCPGENFTIGAIPVIKSTVQISNYTQYMWCTRTNPVLKITHRTSTAPFRAVSTINYSQQIENMISTLRFNL